jgi:Ca2+/Na+ antiporter
VTDLDTPLTPPPISQLHLAEVGTCDACLRSGRQRLNVGLALAVTLPGAYVGLALLTGLPHPELTPPLEVLVFGLAVVGAAFLLSWAAELAALEISAGLAIAVLALVAVLPEYAVDFVFAWRGGNAVQANGTCEQGDQNPCSLALANMTGANRLLIGIGWALVVLLAWSRLRRQGRPGGGVQLPRSSAVEVTYLSFFGFAAVVILLSAEHFADGLVQTGDALGISPFFLVQWLAPLASEAPELLVAGLYAWHLNTTNGLSTLVSSKVNQWTLLVGTLPLVFTVASGTATGLPVGAAQREELLLTAAQSLFAVAVLVNLEISVREAAALSGLFLTQFAIAALVPGSTELVVLGIAYLALAAVLLLRGRRRIGPLLRDGLLTPYPQLQDRRAGRWAGGHRAPPGRERPEASP